jgi:2-O-(6-phospho-alpha-D-mannosyl)-D-glycerate hydrolase
MRCVDIKICTEGRCATVESQAQGSQCPGEHQFEYALYPHSGNCEVSDMYEKMEHFVYSPCLYQMSHHDQGSLPNSLSLFSVNDSSIQMSCVKKTEQPDGIIIRLYNPTDQSRDGVLTFARNIKEACLTDLNETRTGSIEVNRDQRILTVPIGPNKIVTVQVLFD